LDTLYIRLDNLAPQLISSGLTPGYPCRISGLPEVALLGYQTRQQHIILIRQVHNPIKKMPKCQKCQKKHKIPTKNKTTKKKLFYLVTYHPKLILLLQPITTQSIIMSEQTGTNYSNMPREELISKIAKLLKLNYEALQTDPVNTKFKYDEVALMVYDRIATSGDFGYTNIMKILNEFVYNQSDVDELLAKHTQDLNDAKTKLENYKQKCGNDMSSLKRLECEQSEYNIKFTEHTIPIIGRLKQIWIYETYQPDAFACKPRDYEKMLESLDKQSNPRIKAYAEWYANASIKEQNTEFDSKYDEYFESLDDLITLHEICLGIIPIDGLNPGC